MMLSNEPADRSLEIEGLTPQEVKMYDMAWSVNSLCLGFQGLCRIWYVRVSKHIPLVSIYRVIDRLIVYMYFDTDNYYQLGESELAINDYIPGIYSKRRSLTDV